MTSLTIRRTGFNHLCHCHQKIIQTYFATALMEVLNGSEKCSCVPYNLKTFLYLLKEHTLKHRHLAILIVNCLDRGQLLFHHYFFNTANFVWSNLANVWYQPAICSSFFDCIGSIFVCFVHQITIYLLKTINDTMD